MKTKSPQFAQLTKTACAILEEADRPVDCAKELVTFLCQWFDCPWGTYWHADTRKLLLTSAFCWNNETLRAEKLRHDTHNRSLTLSEGTAGHVWRTGTVVCTDNIVRDMCLPRSLDATAVGLRGGIWFPITDGLTTYAVIELLGRHYWNCDDRFRDELKLFGLELGKACAGQRATR